VRAACTAYIIQYTNRSGLCNQINFAYSEMIIKDNAVWEAEQEANSTECLQYMFSRDVLLTSCVLQYMFSKDVLLTICVL